MPAALLGHAFVAPPIRYVVTMPGPLGATGAFLAEFLISVLLMSVILRVSNSARHSNYTGLCAGLLVTIYIILEAPVSGMSMNPARSLAPVLGMQAAAAWYTYRRGRQAVACAKLQHPADQRCIHCGYTPPTAGELASRTSEVPR